MNLRQRLLLACDRDGVEVAKVLPLIKLVVDDIKGRGYNEAVHGLWDEIKDAR